MKDLLISGKISQANQHAKALQKLSKLKNKFRQSAVRQHFKQTWTTSTVSSKDEHVLSPTSYSLLATQADSKYKSYATTPLKPLNAHNLVNS